MLMNRGAECCILDHSKEADGKFVLYLYISTKIPYLIFVDLGIPRHGLPLEGGR
jgi:hypothetical protein